MKKDPLIAVVNGHGLGEYCDVKRIPEPGETCTAYNRRFEMDAGKGTNVACAIGRLGGNVEMVGKCGMDPAGELGFTWCHDSNVKTNFYWLDPSIDTCLGLCIIAENGENLLLDFDDDTFGIQPDEVERCLNKLKDADFVVSGFSQAVESGLKACEVGKANGAVTLLNPSPWRDDLKMPPIPYVDILCINENEAYNMLEIDPPENPDWEKIGRQIMERYECQNVMITLGAQGSAGITPDEYWHIPPTPVKMVDETGAGDGFLAAVTYCLSRGRTLKQAMEWAGTYAAYEVTKSGSLEFYPWAKDIPEIFKSYGKEALLFE